MKNSNIKIILMNGREARILTLNELQKLINKGIIDPAKMRESVDVICRDKDGNIKWTEHVEKTK